MATPRAAGCLLLATCAVAVAIPWEEQTSRHFILRHQGTREGAVVLRHAEGALTRVRQCLGLRHVSRDWTWDDRARITVFADKTAFRSATSAPQWAVARASPSGREISTYALNGSVPYERVAHEVVHLLIGDYLVDQKLPIWLEEGLAQWASTPRDSAEARAGARQLVARGLYTPLARFPSRSTLRDKGGAEAMGLYTQWAQMVEYMIGRYGTASFAELVRRIRDGSSLEQALRFTYPVSADSMSGLEEGFLAWAAPAVKEDR